MNSKRCKQEGFVGVHIGAGQHSEARTALYLDICAAACQAAVKVLREGGSALDAAEKATIILEDAGETNAGFGSNLTESGTLEMDAGLMDGKTLLFGAVGAITEVKNPIRVARKLVDEQAKGLLPLGRVPPGFLVGEGARDWAIRHGINTVSSEKLVSEKAVKLYKHYKKKLDAYKLSLEQNKRKKEEDATETMVCKKFRVAHKLSITEQVRSSDGASKMVDGSSLDLEENSQALIANRGMLIRKDVSASACASISPHKPTSLVATPLQAAPSLPLQAAPSLPLLPPHSTSSLPVLPPHHQVSLPLAVPLLVPEGMVSAHNDIVSPHKVGLSSHSRGSRNMMLPGQTASHSTPSLPSTSTSFNLTATSSQQLPTDLNNSQTCGGGGIVSLPTTTALTTQQQQPQHPGGDVARSEVLQTKFTIEGEGEMMNTCSSVHSSAGGAASRLDLSQVVTCQIKPVDSTNQVSGSSSALGSCDGANDAELCDATPAAAHTNISETHLNGGGDLGRDSENDGDTTVISALNVKQAILNVSNKNVEADIDESHCDSSVITQEEEGGVTVPQEKGAKEVIAPKEKRVGDVTENTSGSAISGFYDEPLLDCDDKVQDTVGVVVLDGDGQVAASVSSGGIALKQSGRVGQASCYGCGCWAQRQVKNTSSSVAVSTTGCGEHLVRTLLAKECGQGLANSNNPMDSLQNIMKEKFAESEFLEGINEKLGGAICMQFNKNSGLGSFLWTHTTASMGIGFQSTGDERATVKMSRLPKNSNIHGTTILVESVSFSTLNESAFKQ